MSPSSDASFLSEKSTHQLSITSSLLLIPIIYFVYTVISSIYIAYLHPLSAVPGPKSWAAFPIIPRLLQLAGILDTTIVRLHAKYGPAVRIANNEVSFTTAEAWQQIYGHKIHPQLPKPLRLMKGEQPSIVTANDADHSRYRKALAHGFSERALRDQEELITSYVDLLVGKLKAIARSIDKTDLVRWYNFTTFDIIGDLCFGESFNCLSTSTYHNWVSNVLRLINFAPIFRGMFTHPVTFKLIAMLFITRDVRVSRQHHMDLVRGRLQRRIDNESQQGRSDFVDSMLRHGSDPKEGGMTFEEMVQTLVTLVLAGSETTATLLSGVTYQLLIHPQIYDKVKAEVRGKFNTEADITMASVQQCEYMMAVLDETLRIYPPAPAGFNRAALQDMEISGVKVPKGTFVTVHQLSAFLAVENWRKPNEFIPERFMKQGKEGEFKNDRRAAHQPFAVGPRNCIGRNLALAEMRLILARVLWNFDFELCPESRNWADQKIKLLWIKHPLMCKVRMRKGA